MITELIGRGLQRLSTPANPEPWFLNWANGGEESSSGEFINEENALYCPAVKAAVSILAETLGTLSLEVREKLSDDRSRPAHEREEHRLLHDEPNVETSSFVWKHTLQMHLGTYGNAYAMIQRSKGGPPMQLWQCLPHRVEPFHRPSDNALWYRHRDEQGYVLEEVPARDIIHIPYFSMNGLIGKSPVRLIKEAIGGNKAAERFANEMFKNGGTPQGYLRHPGKLSEPAHARLKGSINEHASHGGRHKTVILEEGMEFQGTSLDPARVQMIEVRRFLLTEIARAYRITPHLLQDLEYATFSNVTELGRQFITFTMLPWLKLWECELNRKLLKPPYYCCFDTSLFLKGDHVARAAFHRAMFAVGGESVNEIRSAEGWNALDDPNADEHFVPLNMVPLSKATDPEWVKGGKPSGGSPEKPGAPPGGDGKTPNDPNPESPLTPEKTGDPVALQGARAVVADVLRRMDRIEANVALRAAKEPKTFLAKLDKFYAKHAETIAEALAMPLQAVRSLGGGLKPDLSCEQELTAVVKDHIQQRQELLLQAAECKANELPGRVAAVIETWTSPFNQRQYHATNRRSKSRMA